MSERYFTIDGSAKLDPISGERPKKLRYAAGGVFKESSGDKYMPCFDPSTGAVIALAPQCTSDEVEEAIQAAAAAYPGWRETPLTKRVQVLFRMKALLDAHLEELTFLCAQENGKKWDEAMGDVLKVIEVVEFATGAPHILKGDSLFNVSPGYDTVRFNEPLGVFAGIAPWNFPAMIPHGWMAPICIVTGNTLVLKAASFAPQCAMRITELWAEAGLPAGRAQRRHHEPPRGRDSAEASRDPRRHLRRLDRSRQAHLCDRGGERQARAGADRSQEPCAGAERL